MHSLETRLHTEVGAKALQTFHGERVAVGHDRETVGRHAGDHAETMFDFGFRHRVQYGIGQLAHELGDFRGGRQLLHNGRHTLLVLRITLVELGGLANHTREGVLIDLGGAGGHVRNAAGGEAGDHTGREQG